MNNWNFELRTSLYILWWFFGIFTKYNFFSITCKEEPEKRLRSSRNLRRQSINNHHIVWLTLFYIFFWLTLFYIFFFFLPSQWMNFPLICFYHFHKTTLCLYFTLAILQDKTPIFSLPSRFLFLLFLWKSLICLPQSVLF